MSIFLDIGLTLSLGYLWFLASVARAPECRTDRCDRLDPSEKRPLIYRP